ncbi:uncharacterized protein N7446_014159 [Penicillium canescens]|uniref:uncharacterized protein n=1 Tax=Penicillium canescens TaxID=5083 RepID=UPI0026DEEA90|nr:uncharacterized protein N7446_014159 [Penicillium canescens]KAJ6038917.1 hypothetical protein N7446_014159 [Penicillium canescens]KAJ6066245.1 hypothetical protein N7444_000183 [Penicillium canescens]KAJ6170926.1 hypothetical protein N7485_007055 [Penicillium canescens]
MALPHGGKMAHLGPRHSRKHHTLWRSTRNEAALPSYDVTIESFPGPNWGGSTAGALDVHFFHSHGLHFYDIGSGPGTYNITDNGSSLKFRQPIQRDTTMLYRYSTTAPTGQAAGWGAWRVRLQILKCG